MTWPSLHSKLEEPGNKCRQLYFKANTLILAKYYALEHAFKCFNLENLKYILPSKISLPIINNFTEV